MASKVACRLALAVAVVLMMPLLPAQASPQARNPSATELLKRLSMLESGLRDRRIAITTELVERDSGRRIRTDDIVVQLDGECMALVAYRPSSRGVFVSLHGSEIPEPDWLHLGEPAGGFVYDGLRRSSWEIVGTGAGRKWKGMAHVNEKSAPVLPRGQVLLGLHFDGTPMRELVLRNEESCWKVDQRTFVFAGPRMAASGGALCWVRFSEPTGIDYYAYTRRGPKCDSLDDVAKSRAAIVMSVSASECDSSGLANKARLSLTTLVPGTSVLEENIAIWYGSKDVVPSKIAHTNPPPFVRLPSPEYSDGLNTREARGTKPQSPVGVTSHGRTGIGGWTMTAWIAACALAVWVGSRTLRSTARGMAVDGAAP